MNCKEIIAKLKSLENKKNVAGMARFGINPNKTFGVSIPELRKLSKQIGKNHELAQELWQTGIHEARLLAGFIAEPEKAAEALLESWVQGFDSWDVCDQVCSNFFDQMRFAYQKAFEWSKREKEFEKRAGFVLMACLAVHDKNASDSKLEKFFVPIKREACDERNFVKKAVNWALRQIGKRNPALRKKAIATARQIAKCNCKSANWIARDALRELERH